MAQTIINPNRNGGPVTLNVDCANPQITAGVVFRFNADGSFDTEAGTYTNDKPDVSLGAVADIDGKQFSIEGIIKATNDNPPTPYKIVVTVSQDGNILKQEIPDDHGKGTVGATDVRYNYQFTITAV